VLRWLDEREADQLVRNLKQRLEAVHEVA